MRMPAGLIADNENATAEAEAAQSVFDYRKAAHFHPRCRTEAS